MTTKADIREKSFFLEKKKNNVLFLENLHIHLKILK
jgi:hypothetical protein